MQMGMRIFVIVSERKMKHVPKEEEVKIADSLDLSRVDKNDRGDIRSLIACILQYEEPMPKVTIRVFDTHSHYNISIQGWSQYLSITKLYKTFIDPEIRDSRYESIIDMECCPINDEGVPVLKFKIRKSNYVKIKRRH